MKRVPGALLLALLPLAACPRPTSADPPPPASAEEGTACVVPAFAPDDDAGLLAAYDGVRRGLEEAHLPRICRRRVEGDDAAAWERAARETAEKAPPFVFAFGRKAAARVAAAPFERHGARIPTIVVDVATVARGVASPPPPEAVPPAAIVRAEPSVERWGRVLAGLFPGRPRPGARLPWTRESPEAARLRAAAAEASGLDLRLAGEGLVGADLVLDWTPGAGEEPMPFEAVLREARALRVPVVSTDRGRFGRGAAVVIVPDHALLGRVAADAARRLRDGEGRVEPLRLAVRATEVWVDLEAAGQEGLDPPLPFLAAADRVRRALPGADDGR